MKLRDLDAMFLKRVSDAEYRIVDSLAEADGVQFQCPKCSEGKDCGEEIDHEGGPRRFARGAHYVLCWFRGRVPDATVPKPGRWTPQGTGIDDLTFVPGSPPLPVSVLLVGPGCGWHGHIVNGEATLQ